MSKELTVWCVDTHGVAQKKPKRQLPTTREERFEAYNKALLDLEKIFRASGFEVVCLPQYGSMMVRKAWLEMSIKLVENDGRIAYVTSGPGYSPDKAGKKGSGAQIITSRTMLKSRDLLQVIVSGRQSVPIFVELRQNIPDPELHICKSALFVLQSALDNEGSLKRILQDVSNLSEVPAEWLPQPNTAAQIFGMEDENPTLPPGRGPQS